MKLNDFPKVLLQKIMYTILIGMACFLLGAAYYFAADDRIFLVMSIIMLIFCVFRALSVYLVVKKQDYVTIEGVCVGVSSKAFGRSSRVRIMDEKGLETTLRLHKSNKMRIGEKYRFYLQRASSVQTGSEYLSTIIAEGNLLGFEFLGEIE